MMLSPARFRGTRRALFSRPIRAGFSLVEVSLAIGIAVIALLSVVGLLSVGIRNNRISVEETRASFLLTLVEADLRNTMPGSGVSGLFGLPLPYATNTAGGVIVNPSLEQGKVYTTGLTDAEIPASVSSSPRPRYQASVIFTRLPAQDSLLPIAARLVVNWPAVVATNAAALTGSAVSGSVEGLVTFSAP